MQELFLELVRLSLTGSLFVLAVILVRILFRKAPKWLFCLLWGLVALRLICPFSIESELSVVPDRLASGQIIRNAGDDYIGKVDFIHENNAGYNNAVEAGRQPIYSDGGYYVVTEKDSYEEPKTVENTVYPILSWVWFTGMLAMLTYTAVSYHALKRKMEEATLLRDNIWQCEQADSPFVLGILKPRIYLPYQISDSDADNVIAHEQAHIHRKDHWWKPIGFLLLSIYWFNPVMWAAYILLCRDIEAACDEKVIKHMKKDEMRAYSTALLNCSIHRRRIAACPLAFGEEGVRERIKRVMNYKKPACWIILLTIAVSIAACVMLLTNPTTDDTIIIPKVIATDCITGQQAKLRSFGYSASKQGEEVIACGIAPWQDEYSDDEMLVLDGMNGQNQILLEPQGFTLSYYKIYLPDGTVYDDGTRTLYDSLGSGAMYSDNGVSLIAPSQTGEYIYEVELKWPEQDITVTYGLKVIMTDKESAYDIALRKIFEQYGEENPLIAASLVDSFTLANAATSQKYYVFEVENLSDGPKRVAVSADGKTMYEVSAENGIEHLIEDEGTLLYMASSCSKDSVDELISIIGEVELGGLSTGMKLDEEHCYNVTPPSVAAQTNIKIFKFSGSCVSLALIDGEVYSICESFGGHGFVNAVPWDYDEDGNMDLLVASSWGSGLHRSIISVFNTRTKESIVVFDTSYTDNPSVDLFVSTVSPSFSSKAPQDPPAYYVYTANIAVKGNNLADLSYVATGVIGSVVVENGTPVFKPMDK
ncbi:MAG: M56 family metallopeptidase [Faecousia sp.]